MLFLDSGLYQSPGSLKTHRRTCTVSKQALFCSSTSLIIPGIWASQAGNLTAIAPSAPTTAGIIAILTFHSCSSLIFDGWYLLIFSSYLFWMFSFLGTVMSIMRPVCFLWSICTISGWLWSRCLSFWIEKFLRFFAQSFLSTFSGLIHQSPVLKVKLSTYNTAYYWGHIVVYFSILGLYKLASTADNMCHGLCTLLAQPASGI